MITKSYLNIQDEDMDNIRRWLIKTTAIELSNIIKSCYMPKINRYFKDFSFLLGNIEKENIQNFMSQLDNKYRKFNLLADPFTISILMLITESAKRNNKDVVKLSILFLAIKFYASLVHILFPKFCSDEVWKYTLTTISSKNLIRDKGNTGNFVRYIAEDIIRKHFNRLYHYQIRDSDMIAFIIELRTRLAQSLYSFARNYYNNIHNKSLINKAEENIEEENILKLKEIINDACNSSRIDEKIIYDASKRSNIKLEIAKYIITELLSPVYINDWVFIINLYTKVSGGIKNICVDKSIIYYTNLIAIGKANVSKYNIRQQIENMYKKTESSSIYKDIDIKNIVKLIITYIVLHIKKRFC